MGDADFFIKTSLQRKVSKSFNLDCNVDTLPIKSVTEVMIQVSVEIDGELIAL